MNPTPKASSTRAQLPVGPSGAEPVNAPEGALAYADDTDKVRVKTSAGWVDVGGGGGGGSITSIVEGPGIDVTNPGGPVVTIEVDPSEVLLAGDVNGPANANQVNKIHETSGPTTLTIGAIADGQVLQRVGSTVVGVAGGLPSGNPYVDPPLVPGPYDDEFDGGSPDLALRGWTIKNGSNVVMTRNGDVVPWNPSPAGLTATTYNSTLVGSQLLIQLLGGAVARVYKAIPGITASSGALFWLRGGNPDYATGASVLTCVLGLNLWAASGGNPDDNNRVLIQMFSTGSAGPIGYNMGTVVGGSANVASGNSTLGNFDIAGAKLYSGSNDWRAFIGDSRAGMTNSHVPGLLAASSIAFVGFGLADGAGGTGSPNSLTARIYSIDFFRSASGANAWIAQTPKVSVTGTYAGLPTGNPYVDPPAVASSFDDEFETGSADLATRGYSVTNSAGTVLTRAGGVDPWNATGPVAGTYLSSIVGSQLLVQFPNGASTYTISKPVTLATGDTYFARVGSSNRFDSGTQSNTLEFGFYATAGGTADTNNRIYVSSFSTTSGASGVEMFRGTAGAYSGSTRSPIGAQIGDIRGVNWVSGTTYRPFITDSSDGDTQTTNVTGAIASTAVQVVAFRFTPNTAWVGTMPVVISIDFLRKTTGNAWIAQTPRPVLWNVVNGNITDYTQKPAPVAADQIYIADSAAANAIKRATLDTALVAPMQVLSPPASPSAFDDEFSSGSSDLATRGWAILDVTTGVALTRAGSVSYMGALPAAGTYNSDIVRGQLVLQIPFGVQVFISKAVTSTNPYTYAMRGSSQALNHCWLWTNSSSTFGTGNGYGVGQVSGSLRGCGIASKTGTTFTQRITYGSSLEGTSDTFWLSVPASGTGTFAAQTINPYSGFPFYYTTTALTSYTPAFAGVQLYCNGNPSWFTIDFVRQYAGQGVWFA